MKCFLFYASIYFENNLAHPRKGLPSVFWAERHTWVQQFTGILLEEESQREIKSCKTRKRNTKKPLASLEDLLACSHTSPLPDFPL